MVPTRSDILRPWMSDALLVSPYPERQPPVAGPLDEFVSDLGRIVASPFRAGLASPRPIVRAAELARHRLRDLSDEALTASVTAVRARLIRDGLTRSLVGETFAHVREATRRHLGFEHHPVQLMGGYVMLRGRMAEMRTGEGKTVTALLCAATAALAGMPVHVVTVNEYLAARDADELGPIYRALGLSVGLAQHGQDPPVRRAAYAADVTYCTNKELVFDYLRDRIAARVRPSRSRQLVGDVLGTTRTTEPLLLRGLHCAFVDEADSILVDEARTPLIISAPTDPGHGDARVIEALSIAGRLVPGHDFVIQPADKLVFLTSIGRKAAEALSARAEGLWRSRRAREELLTQALSALHVFRRDHQYIVNEGAVQIVDEYTGRVMADRKWQRGLQQLIEAKEGCAPSEGRETIAQVTYQRFFRRYLWLGGMTGTAREVSAELGRIYGLEVVPIPTHEPNRRREGRTRFYRSSQARWDAVVASTREKVESGRPVLIGTRSVAASEHIADRLRSEGLAAVVLNARQDRDEAETVAAAGLPSRITVATNMAGRGTDIRPAGDVLAQGGLHVILTEFHESARIDRQLFGRTGRQGNPGTAEALVSLDDELFRHYSARPAAWLMRFYPGGRIPPALGSLLRGIAQWRAEHMHARMRRDTFRRSQQQEKAYGFMSWSE